MKEHEIKINFTEYGSLAELDTADKELCEEAVKALDTSHSPYSKFRVGVAMRLQSGKILHASNQENVAYPSGLCAERVALFYWGANYADDPIQSMAVTAYTDEFQLSKPVTSCGACLQVLAEYEKKQGRAIKMLLYCKGGPVWVATGIESFLPFLFFEDRLK
ncbi:cytidine deaminase [Mucilaginibacter sp.]|jgi:cytidine deaminase|uniref:cytidine deaminase n=1 Tax=Mucilaginibacter sp. TaxID=1882438 RepID=UPI002C0BAC73|nr:cytidine deaminase [Mucilaginibacter sp.]HTI61176.1 cytidine deaminase [Mucilaginibacter sp.]